ncbi:hypothetical protein OIV83_005898 [Microbotryomycetes sp. JL201]|nr:hypothetical protein OIV83_005898 [Microbotryomycetes sp. JL201]
MRATVAAAAIAGLVLAAASVALPQRAGEQQVRLVDQLGLGPPGWVPPSPHYPPLPGSDEQDGEPDEPDEELSHFSQWSIQHKRDFLEALSNNQAQDWVICMGNEAGDTDSMVAALALAYTFSHDKENPHRKAVALLQTELDALYLRPENGLVLHYARFRNKHGDILSVDELTIKPVEMAHRIKGIALVDHNVPQSVWSNATVVAIIDHHVDRGMFPEAKPRLIEMTGSSTSLVAKYMLDVIDTIAPPGHFEAMHGPIPQELIEMMLRTIALDTSGLKRAQTTDTDRETAKKLFALSSWSKEDIKERMSQLDDELSASKKDLRGLDVRALLRRDWKGDGVATKSKRYPTLSLGFASAPVSLEEQISRTPEGTAPEWFAIERAWTSEIGADVSVCLTNSKDKHGNKQREIAIVVAHVRDTIFLAVLCLRSEMSWQGYGKRLHEHAANSLFKSLVRAVENAGVPLKKWDRPDGKELLPRRAVWVVKGTSEQGQSASRKFWRPILEQAVKEWRG